MTDTEINTFEKIWKMLWDFLYAVFEKLQWNRISKEESEYWVEETTAAE